MELSPELEKKKWFFRAPQTLTTPRTSCRNVKKVERFALLPSHRGILWMKSSTFAINRSRAWSELRTSFFLIPKAKIPYNLKPFGSRRLRIRHNRINRTTFSGDQDDADDNYSRQSAGREKITLCFTATWWKNGMICFLRHHWYLNQAYDMDIVCCFVTFNSTHTHTTLF